MMVRLLAVLVFLCAAGDARAEITDLRGPVRVGWGASRLLKGEVLSLSLEDQLSVHRFARGLELQLVFGMDGQRGPAFLKNGEEKHRGFLGIHLGTGLLVRPWDGGPALVGSVVMGPLWESHSEDLAPHGIGTAARADLFPLYQDLQEIVRCKR